MNGNTPASVEYTAAQKKFDQANVAHRAMMDKYFFTSELVAGEPMNTGAVPSLMAFDEIVGAIEQLKEAEQRLARATKAYRWERGPAAAPGRRI